MADHIAAYEAAVSELTGREMKKVQASRAQISRARKTGGSEAQAGLTHTNGHKE